MRIYIIRHADPDYANKTITKAGHLEAKALADRMQRQGLDRIFVSPLGRARHTMKYTADLLGMEHTVLDWVQEIGEFSVPRKDGGHEAAWNTDGEIIRRRPLPTSENWQARPPFDDPSFPGVYNYIKNNSDEFITSLGYSREDGAYRITARNNDQIAVFCHGGFGLTWIAHLLDLPLPLVWSGMFIAPSSVTTILFDERTETHAVPRCIALGDTSHLYNANLPIQPSGIVANFI
ncbi:MAG: histidine phosphatase family protein [Spirochaetales bacterium]|jgi:broad specificity phosphatase PhoE|nr:histidine phosphatase family protein [Spirochaetales bacterium]